MRCHYEVFELPRNTTNEEIKKQYKKLALKYHPDKNVGNEEHATELFKELQVAYAVLNDPHERKWYDDHRESILRGGDGTAGSGDSEIPDSPLTDLMKYFNTSCFRGFSDDDPQSFYTIYGNLFVEIHNIDYKEQDHVPSTIHLGTGSSTNSEVHNFYSHWTNFVSNLSFSWEDKYNTTDAPNRFVKRAMEKENKKLREVARKKYIDTVRTLATYVQRRDPRVAKIELERKKKEEEDLKRRNQLKLDEKERKRLQREKWRNYKETDEEIAARERERKGAFLLVDEDEDEDDHKRVYDNEGEDNYDETGMVEDCNIQNVEDDKELKSEDQEVSEESYQILRCEICRKDFKADSQLQQHLQSKVHKKKLQEINKQQKKNKGKGKDSKSPSITSNNQKEEVSESDDLNDTQNEQEINEQEPNEDQETVERDEIQVENGFEKQTHNEINRNSSDDDSNNNNKNDNNSDDESDFENDLNTLTENLRKKKALALESSDSEDDNQKRRKKRSDENSTTKSKNSKGKKSKQQSKDTKTEKKVNKSVNESHVEDLFGEEGNVDELKNDEQSTQHTCKMCGYDAPSKNKLFQHIQQTGHAALKEANEIKVDKKKKKDRN